MAMAFGAQQAEQNQEYPVSLDPDLVAAMNSWRLSQDPVLQPNDAIVALIRLGLETAHDAQFTAADEGFTGDANELVENFRLVLARALKAA